MIARKQLTPNYGKTAREAKHVDVLDTIRT